MKIRNLNETHQLIPSQHREAAVGQEIQWPAEVPVPSGFVITEGTPVDQKPPKPPTKKELLAEAAELGLTLDSKLKVDELRALVAQHKLDRADAAEAALESEPDEDV